MTILGPKLYESRTLERWIGNNLYYFEYESDSLGWGHISVRRQKMDGKVRSWERVHNLTWEPDVSTGTV